MTLPPRLFCDTSFFYACLRATDQHHDRATEIVQRAASTAFVTTWDVVSETATLLRYRASYDAACRFLAQVVPTLSIPPYGDRVQSEAMEIFRMYGSERRLSMCDAISFVMITTLLDDMPCLTFDRDFRTLGLTVIA